MIFSSWLRRVKEKLFAQPGPCPYERSHRWEVTGYGGAGWYTLRCSRCGKYEIG